jgi:hypothetical protein
VNDPVIGGFHGSEPDGKIESQPDARTTTASEVNVRIGKKLRIRAKVNLQQCI